MQYVPAGESSDRGYGPLRRRRSKQVPAISSLPSPRAAKSLSPPAEFIPLATDSRGIVASEANYGEPSRGDFEKMARRRFQDPRPKRLGKWWYLLTWQDEFQDGRRKRKRKRTKLAPANTPEREVRRIAAEILRPLNQGLVTVGSATKFVDYVEGVYKPTMLPTFASSTRDRYQGVIRNYLVPAFGGGSLGDITPATTQRYFSGMAASGLSHESQDKIRDVLSSILGSAVKYGYLVKNPVEGVRLAPPKRGKRNKPYITPEQFQALLALVAEPYATMLFVAVHVGLRVSELIGLRWSNLQSDSITIDERYCRGDWGTPKSEASNATIPVSREGIERIERLKTLTIRVKAGSGIREYRTIRAEGPNELVFQSLVKAGPMRDNNILVRHIKPAGRQLGIGWVNWQVLRRSFATWLKMSGADVKDAQALMRHSRASTTLDIYQQFVPESQRRAVDRLMQLSGTGVVN